MKDEKKLDKVQKLLDELYDTHSMSQIMITRQSRLKELSRIHGIQCTALAAGLTVSTLTQYLRVKHPATIGEQSVTQAEQILSQL